MSSSYRKNKSLICWVHVVRSLILFCVLLTMHAISGAATITAFSSIGQVSNSGHSITPSGWDVGGSFHVSESGYLTDVYAGVFGGLGFRIYDSIDNSPNNLLQSFGLSSNDSFTVQHASFNGSLFLDSNKQYFLIASSGDGGFMYGNNVGYEQVAKKYGNNTIWSVSTANSSYRLPAFSITVSTVPISSAVWLFSSGLIGLIGIAKRKKKA